MKKIQFVKVADALWLAAQTQEDVVAKAVDIKTHHTFIIDCSYSMYNVLPAIQVDLCNKIATTLKDGDALSLIWFSSRGQCGVILENYQIDGPMDLETARSLVKKYLKPVGLTAFVDPLKLMKDVIQRVDATSPGFAHSMFFMSDGYDNQYSTREILSAAAELKDVLSSATMVEYGWYCNRKLMTEMAAELGGSHLFSEGFQEFEPAITNQLTLTALGKRRRVELAHPADDWAFTVGSNGVSMQRPDDGAVLLAENDDSLLYYLTSTPPSECQHAWDEVVSPVNDLIDSLQTGLYAAALISSKSLATDKVHSIMKTIGDVVLVEKGANAFGTQKITEFEGQIEAAVMDPSMRYLRGYDPNAVPAEDAYCFMDMIDDLMEDDKNMFYPRHEDFKYERTSVKTKQSEEQDALMYDLVEENPGVMFKNLVWNSKRANLSVQACFDIDLNLPKSAPADLPNPFRSKIYRNYTVVKDGIIHTYVLPVSLSATTFVKLQNNGLLEGETWEEDKIYKLDFSSLPVININMAKTRPSAEKLAKLSYELLKLQAWNKVFNYIRKEHGVERTTDGQVTWGVDAAAWLTENGIKPYGYSPKQVTDKVGEEQQVPALEVKIKGMSLPSSPKPIFEKIDEDSQLTPREQLLEVPAKAWLQFKEVSEGVSQTAIDNWLRDKNADIDKKRRKLLKDIATMKFIIIVGQQWFNEFESRQENDMELDINGNKVMFVFDDSEQTIKL